ncbi:MAG: glycosyltransferase family 2 protein [Terriglobales bacterium]
MVSRKVIFTVCIPTLNASAIWKEFWPALTAQTLQPSEVLVLDSSSTDNTVEQARRDGCRVVTIPAAEFRHGGTRQLAAGLARDADLLVYLTQDSILADANAMANLVAAFQDTSIAAAYGRQLPRPNANPIEAHARLFNYPPVSAVRSLESRDTLGFKAIFFSNSFGAYRRTALEQVGGFPLEANFGEDTVVVARLLERGWRVAYVAEAPTYHSHAYSFREEFRRYCLIGQLHGNEPWLLRDFGTASGEGGRFAISEIRYLFGHAPWLIPEAIVRTALKYLGYKRGSANPRH